MANWKRINHQEYDGKICTVKYAYWNTYTPEGITKAYIKWDGGRLRAYQDVADESKGGYGFKHMWRVVHHNEFYIDLDSPIIDPEEYITELKPEHIGMLVSCEIGGMEVAEAMVGRRKNRRGTQSYFLYNDVKDGGWEEEAGHKDTPYKYAWSCRDGSSASLSGEGVKKLKLLNKTQTIKTSNNEKPSNKNAGEICKVQRITPKITRGKEYRGNPCSGRVRKPAIAVGHLSNKAASF